MSYDDYNQIVQTLFCGKPPAGVVQAAWFAGVPAHEVPDWYDRNP